MARLARVLLLTGETLEIEWPKPVGHTIRMNRPAEALALEPSLEERFESQNIPRTEPCWDFYETKE